MDTEEQIQQAIMEQFRQESRLSASKLVATVKAGKVTLSGYVDSYHKRLIAEMAVKRVSVTLEIIDEIRVVNFASSLSDAEIAASVSGVLKKFRKYGTEPIRINVKNGIVRLEGKVKWNFQRQNLQSAIEGVKGVLKVDNQISIESQNFPPANESDPGVQFHRRTEGRAAA